MDEATENKARRYLADTQGLDVLDDGTPVTVSGIDVYRLGIYQASVCAPRDMTEAEVAAALNEKHPTGTSCPWGPSPDVTFCTGESNPCACNDEPLTRLHWLLSC